jgi:hypothetical protein
VATSQELDHQVSERFELSSAVDKTVQDDLKVDAGVSYSEKLGVAGEGSDISASANMSYGTSTSTSEKNAQNYAKDVVNRSVSKIEKNVRQLVSRTLLSKTREINKHIYDRRQQDLTVGIYTWVSKTLKAQVFGYDRRMIYEFVLPDPAALYKAALQKAFGVTPDGKFPGGDPPVEPPSASQIKDTNYLTLANTYGVDEVPTPPAGHQIVKTGAGGNYFESYQTLFGGWTYSGSRTETATFTVPAGYMATAMSGGIGRKWNDNTSVASVVFRVGSAYLQWQINGNDIPGPVQLPNLEGQQTASVDAYNLTTFAANVNIECTLKPEALLSWQLQVHKLLVDAYQKRKDAYDAAKADWEKTQADNKQAMQDFIRNRDPFFNREIERTELKRQVISWLSCQFFDRFNAMKKRVQPCGFPQANLPEAQEQGDVIQFWEQGFDWNLIMYVFYPYFWSSKCTWTEKLVQDTGDGLFNKFMEAGAARVQVPVTQGFEDYMLYWEKTGQIWGADGEPPRSDTDSHWISMIEEIKHQQDCYLNDREGRIDTISSSNVVVLKGSDRYWDPALSIVDLTAIAKDLDREIVIDTTLYRIVAIDLDLNSPAFDVLSPDSMWWDITLDRAYGGSAANNLPYAVGAKYVGAPWIVTIPTELIWLKNDTYCLPCYPVTCKGGG